MNTTTEATIANLTTHIERIIMWARFATTPDVVARFEMQAFGAIQFVLYSAEPGHEELFNILSKKWGDEWQPIFWEIETNLSEPEPKKRNSWRLG